MAEQDNVISSKKYIKQGDIQANRPNSEAVNAKIGSSINWLLDNSGSPIVFTGNGFFRPTSISNAVDGVYRVDFAGQIVDYKLTLDQIGVSGESRINIGIYDTDDVFVANLFGSGANGLVVAGIGGDKSGVAIGRKDFGNPLDTIEENVVGVTYQLGNPNIVNLQEGYKLRCFIESNAVDAKNFRLELNIARS